MAIGGSTVRASGAWLVPLALVTIAYLVCYYLTFLVIFPVQNALFGTIPLYASLLYLPHGVRVLTAYFYGWKASLLLTPATILTHYHLSVGSGGGPNLMPIVISVTSAPLSFYLYKLMSKSSRDNKRSLMDWRTLLAVGVLASIINALAVNMYHNELSLVEMLRVILAYLIGDITGQFFTMFALMLCFRWVRNFAEE